MKNFIALLIFAVLFVLASIIPCWGIMPLDVPILAFGQSADWAVIGTDPNELTTLPNINQVYVKSDASKIYFKITSYKNWGNDILFYVDIDADQNVNTGSMESGVIGADYSAEIYLEEGGSFASLLVYDDLIGWYATDADIGDGIFGINTNTLQFSLKLSDLGNPKSINFQALMFITNDIVDIAPNDGYYTYKISGTTPVGNASIIASPANAKFGENITVTYTNAPGNAKDWIGLYKFDAPDKPSISYQYLGGNKNGTLTFVAPGEAGNYNLRMFPNDLYTPLLAVSNNVVVSAAGGAGNETVLQKALAWLAKQQKADGHFGDGNMLGDTAVAVQAFEERGHFPGKGQQYSAIVEKGLDFIFANAVIENISNQKAGNPDSNGNGKGVYFKYAPKYAYETGLCLSAIYASKDPNRIVNTGPCKGWKYIDVVRDVVDFLAFAQDEDKGGWRYEPNVQSDNSAAQWPVFGMLYAAQWGVPAPAWMKSELNRWVNYIQNPPNGASGYAEPGDMSMSPLGRTGGLLIEMYYLDDKSNSARAQKAISYMNNKDNWAYSNIGNAYAVFSVYKGLRLMGVKSLPNAVTGGDWYNDYIQWILKNQSADGSWAADAWAGSCMATGWYIMMLEDTVKPLPTVIPQQPTVTLPADGVSTTNVTVSVNSAEGTPLNGQNVTIVVSPQGNGSMGPIKDNGNGTYTGIYTAGTTPGQVIITITVTNLGISAIVNVTLIKPGTGNTTTVTQAPPATVPANGTSTTPIGITIKNPQGQPVSGQNVTATVNPPGGGTMGPITDNGNGTYTGTFTAGTTPGNVTITINIPGGASTNVNITLTPPGAGGKMLIIPEVTGSAGKQVTVPINITDAAGVAGVDVNVLYNANILKVASINQTTLSAGMSLAQNTNTSGKIIIRLAQTNPIANGSGSLIDMVFNIDANVAVGTETPVRFESAEVFDVNAKTVVYGKQDGKVKIVADCIKGDVNGDGSIKSNDAILALRIAAQLLVPTAQQLCAADYNGDGAVKSNDAILILRKSAGLIAPSKEILSADRYIAISLDEAYGEAGQSITVPLRIDNPDVLAGGDVWIAYDNSVLKAVNVLPENGIMLAGNVSKPGMVRVAFASMGRLTGETIARIKFDVLKNADSPLTIQNFELYDNDGILLGTRALSKEFISYYSKPKYSALLQNFPNPFNPETWIPYQITEDCDVTINILNSLGTTVRKINLGNKPAGLYMTQGRAAYWDGKDDSGSAVASGIYFYSIKAGEYWAVKKMIIVR
jgi:hypothetical protein